MNQISQVRIESLRELLDVLLFVLHEGVFSNQCHGIADCSVARVDSALLNDTSKEGHSMPDRLQVHLARMQFDVEPFTEESPNLREQRLEHIAFASNQDEVIHISAIADSVYPIQPLVQWEQVIVGEDLTRQVANGETTLAFRIEE